MPLSWNDIRARAIAFSKEWEGESSESAEAKVFWEQFFQVFGVTRRRVASFEVPVKKSDGQGGFIDLLWKGKLLVEHKSRGRNLDRAFHQATDYFYGIKEKDLPRYVLVSDFARFRLYDLDEDTIDEFPLEDLHKHIALFGFIAGYEQVTLAKEEAVSVAAAERLGQLHDQLKASGYTDHPLEVLLVRLLFCLFADDTGIFDKAQFQNYLQNRTQEDGSDLGMHLAQLFQVLNTPYEQRQHHLDDQLAAFAYVDGRLFEESLRIASFDRQMRESLLHCCALDWGEISPAIFGSLFQSIMDRDARRNLGAHYTREQNILKVLQPLFLNTLWEEFDRVKRDRKRLHAFHRKLANIRIFDPACGCGNFLVIAYRELRLIELAILRTQYVDQATAMLDVSQALLLDVDQFYGIEIEEFPAQIAQVAMWLTDHQMNMQVSREFGQYFKRLPLKKAPQIVHGNALSCDWTTVVAPDKLAYIVGNPPFVGAKYMSREQRAEVQDVFQGRANTGLLDYVSCWYRKAAEYVALNNNVLCAFVSTNSITQGEQAGVLWGDLLERNIIINFAHRTFQWSSEARGGAAVHCVIIGFGRREADKKWIFEYETPKSEPQALPVAHINPYLVDAPDILLNNRSTPISDVPGIGIGNKPIDGGHYLFTTEEKNAFLQKEPRAARWFRRWIGSKEFLNGYERWCLWLGQCPPRELRSMPEVLKRVEAVRQLRLASRSAPTQGLADTPTRFHVENMPDREYLIIPEVSSERRLYMPIGFEQPDTLCSNLVKIMRAATPYHFGVLSSVMHMAWMRAVCGRLKSDYRYSAGIVYNNFPWPEPTEKQRGAIEQAAQAVLDAREKHNEATLADLYDPLSMPADLLKAHQALDRAVDKAYGIPTKDARIEAKRVAFLFRRYEESIKEAA